MKKKIKNVASIIPWKFLFFQWLLPSADIVTDGWSGLNYHKEGHPLWAYSIWALMWGPLVLTVCSEVLNLFGSCSGKKKKRHASPKEGTSLEMKPRRGDLEGGASEGPELTWYKRNADLILKLAAQVPFLQPVIHAIFAIKLYRAEGGIEKAKADYKELQGEGGVTKEGRKEGVVAAAKDYVKWRKEKSRILTVFQGIRLFELIGESGPQAALQLSIALRIGYIGEIQVRVLEDH